MARPFALAVLLVIAAACGGDAKRAEPAASDPAGSPTDAPSVPLLAPPPASVIITRLTESIASGANKAGDTVTVVVSYAVTDSAGVVKIPVGAFIRLRITALEGSSNTRPGGRLMMEPVSVLHEGQQIPLRGRVGRVEARLNGTVLLIERATEITITVEPPPATSRT